jgi:hypothetical protein
MRKGLAIMTLAVLVVPAGASASQLPGPVTRNCERVYGGKTFSPLIKRSWAERKWEDKTPVSQRQAKRIENHRRCARSGKAQRSMVSMAKRQRRQFRDYRQAKLAAGRSWCAPSPHPSGAGCWEIPATCVYAESGGSWSAYNPSGAVGPYQLLGHGAPFPVYTREQAMVHHRIAESLYNASGLGPWVAPAC